MTEASVVAVGTPQSFRQQIARSLELEADEVGWVQSATAAEEMLIQAYAPVDVLVLSPEVKEPDALGLAEFVGRTAPGTAIVLVRDHTWNGLLPAAMRAGIRDVVDMTQGTDELREAYIEMHKLGYGHSVEAWHDGALVGGVYGLAVKGLFGAESMFHRERDASKVALVHLVEHVKSRGFTLFDIQQLTPHTARFGAKEISRREYLKRLDEAVKTDACF